MEADLDQNLSRFTRRLIKAFKLGSRFCPRISEIIANVSGLTPKHNALSLLIQLVGIHGVVVVGQQVFYPTEMTAGVTT